MSPPSSLGTILRDWGAAILFTALFLACWVAQWHAEVLLGANDLDAAPALQWWAHTVENWQSEFLQLAAAAFVVEAGKKVLFRRAAESDRKIDEIHARLIGPK